MAHPIPPKGTYKPSEEMQEIIESVGTTRVVAGQAFAGTGKTSTGVSVAQRYPNKRILVLCFNAANAAEGKQRYPKNATVLTTHGLAYQALPEKRRARLAKQWGTATIRLELPTFGWRQDFGMAYLVHAVLRDFFQSADKRIDPDKHGREAFEERFAASSTVARACDLATRFWMAMCSTEKVPGMLTGVNAISIPHDAYLKQFSLGKDHWGYDLVIFDEAQDANPVMLGMLESQLNAGSHLLYLGDRHQAIYDFRGAVNAMECLPKGAKILPLTQSWRFGPDTASLANLLLGELKGETNRIIGRGEDWDFDEDKPYTRLSRTNAELISFAVGKAGANRQDQRIHWIGGIEKYRVNRLLDAYHLKCGQVDQVLDPYLKRHFASWSEFLDGAQYDHEAKILSELVDTYNDQIPRLVEQIQLNAQPDPAKARYTVTTAHQSKGLEWDQVAVADDFRDPLNAAEKWLAKATSHPFPESEINLLYVVTTRARHALNENRETNEWVRSLKSHRRERKRTYTPDQRDVATPVEKPRRRHPGAINPGGIKPLRIR